jgi:hypothetical protein
MLLGEGVFGKVWGERARESERERAKASERV